MKKTIILTVLVTIGVLVGMHVLANSFNLLGFLKALHGR